MNLPVSNDHNVYILGAGFSVTAGLPTVNGFLNRMRDALGWLQSQNRDSECEAIEEVLKYRLGAASAAYWSTLDLENVEQLFSLASAARDPVSKFLPTAIAATLDYARIHGPDKKITPVFHDNVTSQRYRTQEMNPRVREDAPKIFQMLEDANTEGTTTFNIASLLGMLRGDSLVSGVNSFISFNYDTLVEDALTRLQVPWTYGMDPTKFTFESETKGHQGASTAKNSIPIIKLHGSVNWAYETNFDDKKSILKIYTSYDSLRQAKGSPRLIPPTWSKDIDEQLSSIWKLAIERLSSATRIIIIGFSMPETDLHFRYLIAAGLQRNAWLRSITFVNPQADQLEERARSVFRSSYIDQKLIRFIACNTDRYSNNLASNRDIGEDAGRKAHSEFACWPSAR